MQRIKELIRDIPDFPKPGIVFKDLTPVMRDSAAMLKISRELALPFRDAHITAVAGMEARGFIFGSLVARELNVGFIPLRKPGKLPAETHSVSYTLEYGEASLEVHTDAVSAQDRILLVDDLLATGGTAAASIKLINKAGAEICGAVFFVELDFLNGRQMLDDITVHSLVHF
ncbi:MAG: adenine phosphoribosyltransferase [Proteobacteria bacterium]|nr:adenine phosphoribosyltransferase [Pseudomonadota bacterium]